jgi:hypothetical protein
MCSKTNLLVSHGHGLIKRFAEGLSKSGGKGESEQPSHSDVKFPRMVGLFNPSTSNTMREKSLSNDF